ncbi:MAG: FHA domain-containing protein [Wenzhouxiangellaceae bacterium]|nr:FHA domain-containing protein [Wenzhouxiangellaceae bacterium]
MEVIIEQLGTTNNVLERQKFDQHAVWIGRAFNNDVILTDEHVDASHAKLFFDEHGELWIEDCNSVNGIRRPRQKQHIDRRKVESGEIFLIGRSRVRVFLGVHPVPPAVPIRLSEVFLLWLGKPPVAVGLALLFVVSKVVGTYLNTIGEFRWSLVVERNLSEVVWFVALAIGVYFLSVLFRRGGNFLAHLSLLVLVFFLSSLTAFMLDLAVFNAGDRWYPLLDALDSARGHLMLFVYLWSILYLAFHVSLLRRTLISLVIVAAMVGLDNLPEDSMTRFVGQQSFPVKQQWAPPTLLLVQPSSAAAFDERAAELFETLDEKRIEALEERSDEVEPAERSNQPQQPPESNGDDENLPQQEPQGAATDSLGLDRPESVVEPGPDAPGAEQPLE